MSMKMHVVLRIASNKQQKHDNQMMLMRMMVTTTTMMMGCAHNYSKYKDNYGRLLVD
jgi:hypothetical protein